MFLNPNLFGYDLEVKLRQKEHPTPKVIVVPDATDYDRLVDIAQALF